MWDFHIGRMMDKWKQKKNGQSVEGWIKAVSDIGGTHVICCPFKNEGSELIHRSAQMPEFMSPPGI